jgi:hypothetical protein
VNRRCLTARCCRLQRELGTGVAVVGWKVQRPTGRACCPRRCTPGYSSSWYSMMNTVGEFCSSSQQQGPDETDSESQSLRLVCDDECDVDLNRRHFSFLRSAETNCCTRFRLYFGLFSSPGPPYWYRSKLSSHWRWRLACSANTSMNHECDIVNASSHSIPVSDGVELDEPTRGSRVRGPRRAWRESTKLQGFQKSRHESH